MRTFTYLPTYLLLPSCMDDLLLRVEDALPRVVLEEADQKLAHGLDILRCEVRLLHEVQVEYV
jgi:hypothetical protein